MSMKEKNYNYDMLCEVEQTTQQHDTEIIKKQKACQ